MNDYRLNFTSFFHIEKKKRTNVCSTHVAQPIKQSGDASTVDGKSTLHYFISGNQRLAITF